MATTPMLLQLLRHIDLRFTSNFSMRAYGAMVMARVRSTNETVTNSMQLWLFNRFSLGVPGLGLREIDWTEMQI